MQTKNITNLKHEWAHGYKARSRGSDQVLLTDTALAGLFIFNLHRYVFYFQFAAQFLVCTYYISFARNIFSLHVQFLICMYYF